MGLDKASEDELRRQLSEWSRLYAAASRLNGEIAQIDAKRALMVDELEKVHEEMSSAQNIVNAILEGEEMDEQIASIISGELGSIPLMEMLV